MMSLGLMLVIVLVIIGVILIILLVLFCSDEFDAGRSGAHRSHADCELSNFVQLSPWHRISIAEYGFYAWPRGSEFLAFGPDRFACGASVSWAGLELTQIVTSPTRLEDTDMYISGESLLIILAVGLVAGWLAGQIVQGTGFGIVGDLLIGIAGAFIGSWLLPRLGLHLGSGIVTAIIDATIGAVLLLLVIRLVRGGGGWRRRWFGSCGRGWGGNWGRRW